MSDFTAVTRRESDISSKPLKSHRLHLTLIFQHASEIGLQLFLMPPLIVEF